jgi:membrane-bound lytic murein transglycosylase D
MRRFALILSFAIFAYPIAGMAEPATSYSAPSIADIGHAPLDPFEQGWEGVALRVALVAQSDSTAMSRYADMPGQDPSFQEQNTLQQGNYTNAPEPAVPAASIWTRIRDGFAVPDVKSRRVAQFESWYRKHPEYFERMIARSSLFLHFIVEEIEKRGMPTEIALLPMIESAYNPNAYSRAHASGIWQFIPSTGKNYGLEQNWWHDDRRDVVAATGAALDYLEKLHDEFQDWHLALAAYNWGENGVRRAIKRNKKRGKSTSYYRLRMPRETRNYLPKLQAVTNIIADPEKVGLILPEVPDQPYFTAVEADEHIDVELAARLAEMSIEDFETLNAAYNRPVIASNGERKIILPLDKAKIFTANLEYHDAPLVTWQTYALKKNETVSQVAARFDIDTNKLQQINGVKPYVRLREGHSLLVPMPAHADESNLNETWDRPEFSRPNNFYGTRIVHRIKPGDTLSEIAQRYHVSMRGIKSWNGLKGSSIRAGKKLVIYRDLRVPRVSKMLQ